MGEGRERRSVFIKRSSYSKSKMVHILNGKSGTQYGHCRGSWNQLEGDVQGDDRLPLDWKVNRSKD